VLVGQKAQDEARGIHPLPDPGPPLEQRAQAMAGAIDTRPVAEEAIRRLGLGITPDELLANLRAELEPGTMLIRLTYEGTNLPEATDTGNTVGKVATERIFETSNLTATVYKKARVPDYPTPVSPKPLRNGLLALVVGLALSAALAKLAGREWLRLRRH